MSKENTNMRNYLNSSTSKTDVPDYFYSNDNKETNKRASEAITNRIYNEFKNFFSDTSCFEGTFSMQIKEGSCQYKAPPRRLAYALDKPLKEELKWLQKQQIIVLLGVDETSEWCNSLFWYL